MISVQNVTCAISGRDIVHDVSFEVEGSCAIVGVNGVGKTTLLRTVAGLRAPTSGEVYVGDRNIHSLRPKERAKVVSFVGQEESLVGDLSVTEAVSLGRLPYAKPWENLVDVSDALERVGISELGDRKCGELSGGQRRLVLIARALAQDTPVVLLDEPTNHLDVRHQLDVLAILSSLGRTIVATMHDLDLALAHFDNTVVMQHGRVLAAGRSEEVLTPENIATAFGVHTFVTRIPGARSAHLIIDS